MPTLREKFRGCVAATWVGSAMGASADGLHDAFTSRLSRTREWLGEMGAEDVIA